MDGDKAGDDVHQGSTRPSKNSTSPMQEDSAPTLIISLGDAVLKEVARPREHVKAGGGCGDVSILRGLGGLNVKLSIDVTASTYRMEQ